MAVDGARGRGEGEADPGRGSGKGGVECFAIVKRRAKVPRRRMVNRKVDHSLRADASRHRGVQRNCARRVRARDPRRRNGYPAAHALPLALRHGGVLEVAQRSLIQRTSMNEDDAEYK